MTPVAASLDSRTISAVEGGGPAALQPTSQLPSQSRHPEPAALPTYYDQPPLKPSLWGWKVSLYIFIGGLAGSTQIIATAADLAGGPGDAAIARTGRYLGLAGALVGAPLLIADLHTPQRFYNMLRIFRPTSPMSIGTYVLVGFGVVSAALAAVQLRTDLRRGTGARQSAAARILQIPAAALGAAMSTYTGALLGATSTPLWAAAPRHLPAVFGASALGSAAAALSLMPGSGRETLSRIEAVSSAVELCLLESLRRRLRNEGIETKLPMLPLFAATAAPILHQLAGVLEVPRSRPLADGRAVARRSARFAMASGLAVLAGAFLLRHAVLRAGNRSAQRPRDYFRLAQPR